MKSLYEKVVFDPTHHRTFFKQKRYDKKEVVESYDDKLTRELVANDKVNNLWEMNQVRIKLQEIPPEPQPQIREQTPPQEVNQAPKFLFKTVGMQLDGISGLQNTPYPKVSIEVYGIVSPDSLSETVLFTYITTEAEAIDNQGGFGWAYTPERVMLNKIPVSNTTSVIFKILVQDTHLSNHKVYTSARENLDYFSSSGGAKDVVFNVPMKASKDDSEKIRFRVIVYKTTIPDWKPFIPKLVFPRMPADAWIKADIKSIFI